MCSSHIWELLLCNILLSACTQANGGPAVYEHNEEWEALCIVAECVKNGRKLYLVRWKGYDHTYDTWQEGEAILDKNLIASFDLSINGIRHELWLLRDATAEKMLQVKVGRARSMFSSLASTAPLRTPSCTTSRVRRRALDRSL